MFTADKKKPTLSYAEWKDAIDAINSLLAHESENNTSYKYFFIGSSAYILHGVQFTNPEHFPNDIDICSTHPSLTKKILSDNLNLTVQPNSSITINKFLITMPNNKEIALDSIHLADFGLANVIVDTKDQIKVTSLLDTLFSIYLRPTQRLKDVIAFKNLIRNNAEALFNSPQLHQIAHPNFKNTILGLSDLYRNNMSDPKIDKIIKNILPKIDIEVRHSINFEITPNTISGLRNV